MLYKTYKNIYLFGEIGIWLLCGLLIIFAFPIFAAMAICASSIFSKRYRKRDSFICCCRDSSQ